MPVFLVMLGPPGAGKGTQAKKIAASHGLTHISSGDLFRENIKNVTELGKLASTYINKGELVPDEVTISMVAERLTRPDCEKGAVLDGFPRTTAQAEALDQLLADCGFKLNLVPYIVVPESELVERLAGRWTCRKNGHIYHQKFNPPKQAGICDIDGSELYQREDDKPETVKNRIQVYFKQTAPLIQHYKDAGILVEVDGNKPIDKVLIALQAILPEVD